MTKAKIFRMAVLDGLFVHLILQQLLITDISNPLIMVGVFMLGFMVGEMIQSHIREAMGKSA